MSLHVGVRGMAHESRAPGVPAPPQTSTMKILAKSAGGNLLFFTPLGAGGGAGVMVTVKKDAFTTTNSVGSPAELYRCTDVQRLTEAYAFHHAASATSGTWTDTVVALGTVGVGSNLKVWATTEQNAYKEFSFTGDFVDIGCFRSPGGSSSYSVTVDGVAQSVQSLVGTTGVLLQRFSGFGPGAHTLRITHTGASGSTGTLRVSGIHFVQMGVSTPYTATRDSFAYGSPNASGQNNYITSDGAQDYALMRASDSKWAGSYHGGETRDNVTFTVDGVSVDAAAASNGTCIGVGNGLKIEQTTHFGWDATDIFDTTSTTDFTYDGGWEFTAELTARPPGGVGLSNCYTQMTTSGVGFTQTERPIWISTDSDGVSYPLGQCSFVRQRDPTRGWIIDSYFRPADVHVGTQYGAYVLFAAGAYAKLYDGPVVGSSLAVERLQIQVRKVFS